MPKKGIGDLVTQGAGWLTTFLKSLWSGGRALISLFSLIVVTPVVAFYLLYDWHKMLRSVDNAVPVQQRATVRRLARECDAAISGFVRGQTRGLRHPRHVLCRGADAERAQFRIVDRAALPG